MGFRIDEKNALIVVDVQRDFCPGGALPVPEGDKVVPILNDYIRKFEKAGAQVYATRDWHPHNHVSFGAHRGAWPPHCIQGSRGAEFHPDLKLPDAAKIISKGTDASKEAYSGFDQTELKEELDRRAVKRVFVGGLATDYCVKSTVLDAIKLGFETVLLSDATFGVNLEPDDSKNAVEEMIAAGAKTATLSDILEPNEIVSEITNTLEGAVNKSLKRAEQKMKLKFSKYCRL